MVRNAQDTKRRILAAATEEFTEHGIAGARVDRIAAAANSNKAMLYAYFGNKEQLFEAVFALMVAAAADAVPFEARDLPAYAVAMFERYRTGTAWSTAGPARTTRYRPRSAGCSRPSPRPSATR